ncbi:ribose 5-phosphate isomerase B [Mesoplasma chauliocola]|uniref:Ribose 5-phosphate isomerase B n=1 Tax=Mesoplasma chauliocola TaxID=216427 RepID=A0A249SMG8_9MOLU|nr:RpiB/LacA/LacB family sugar-phosphate isomerase [Mesoplasma chauliocola]ASZ08865.1 ribose 5-phosphate isomerase B [Mesoplasma chauliocola]
MGKIFIANDHTAIEMKNAIKNHLISKGYEVVDLGNNDGQSCNYANIGITLAEAVVAEKDSKGIALCGTGIGISIAANKVQGARAGLVYEVQTAELTRQHNNANILATGARLIASEKAILLVDTFLNTKFEGGRHQERVGTLDEYNK